MRFLFDRKHPASVRQIQPLRRDISPYHRFNSYNSYYRHTNYSRVGRVRRALRSPVRSARGSGRAVTRHPAGVGGLRGPPPCGKHPS
jgi:hypothetical protein